jgi:hypothetical protein
MVTHEAIWIKSHFHGTIKEPISMCCDNLEAANSITIEAIWIKRHAHGTINQKEPVPMCCDKPRGLHRTRNAELKSNGWMKHRNPRMFLLQILRANHVAQI